MSAVGQTNHLLEWRLKVTAARQYTADVPLKPLLWHGAIRAQPDRPLAHDFH